MCFPHSLSYGSEYLRAGRLYGFVCLKVAIHKYIYNSSPRTVTLVWFPTRILYFPLTSTPTLGCAGSLFQCIRERYISKNKLAGEWCWMYRSLVTWCLVTGLGLPDLITMYGMLLKYFPIWCIFNEVPGEKKFVKPFKLRTEWVVLWE